MIEFQRLTERYRPDTLAGIVGQPAVKALRSFARNPYASCWILTGPAGVGKSSAALALAAELGAVDDWTGLHVLDAVKIGRDDAEQLLRSLWLRSLGGRWKVVILEEMERLSQQASCILKRGLASEHLPPNTVIVATSNDTSAIDDALLERFGSPLEFRGWKDLADAGMARVAYIWQQEMDCPLPSGAEQWGWHRRDGRPIRYSLRAAIDACQRAILESEVSHATT